MSVRCSPRALRDLDAIFAYIDERSPAGALSVKRAIYRTIEILALYPNIRRTGHGENVNALPVANYPYLIYWTQRENDVVVVHVRHAHRVR